jgi:Ca-activated chloride channel family protein
LSFERVDIDSDTLQHIAEATGGRFFAARRSRDLAAIYADIDALERIARPLPPRVHRSERPEPMLGLAGLFLTAEIVTVRVLRRRLP